MATVEPGIGSAFDFFFNAVHIYAVAVWSSLEWSVSRLHRTTKLTQRM